LVLVNEEDGALSMVLIGLALAAVLAAYPIAALLFPEGP
jgi:hypothetical protein